MTGRDSIRLLLGLPLLWASACSPIPHAWQHQRAKDAAVQMEQWPSLARNYHCRVDARSRQVTTARLEQRDFIGLAPEDVVTYCTGFTPPAGEGVAPYLIRGVAHPWPAYSVVRFEGTAGRCAVYQATWDGENMLGVWASRKVQPSPVIVYLPREPGAVYPVAEMGGDWILETKGYTEELAYAESLCWEQTDFILRIAFGATDDLTNRCSRRDEPRRAAERRD